jgi:achaete-scute complex protein
VKSDQNFMASIHRAMTLAQNYHLLQNNCLIQTAGPATSSSVMLGKRPLAPATVSSGQHSSSSLANTALLMAEAGKCNKKKYNYGNLSYTQTASVQRRNARERNRVKQVNNGFANLRQHIPTTVASSISSGASRGANKKLSKVDTLKMAVEYIRSLQQMLDDTENDANSSTGSVRLGSSSSSFYKSVCSEPSSSPTPSYASDTSAHSYTQLPTTTASTQHQHHQFKSEPFDTYIDPSSSPAPSYTSDMSGNHPHMTATYSPHIVQPVFKTAPVHYEAYEPMSPENEDDLLLDAITWWQQQ